MPQDTEKKRNILQRLLGLDAEEARKNAVGSSQILTRDGRLIKREALQKLKKRDS